MSNVTGMLIESRPVTDPELGALLTAQQRELREAGRTGGIPCHDDISYLVVCVGGRVVACGAWRPADPDPAEIVGTYVRPAFRNQGIGPQLAVALEEMAMTAASSYAW